MRTEWIHELDFGAIVTRRLGSDRRSPSPTPGTPPGPVKQFSSTDLIVGFLMMLMTVVVEGPYAQIVSRPEDRSTSFR
jgi:hypothetical protein